MCQFNLQKPLQQGTSYIWKAQVDRRHIFPTLNITKLPLHLPGRMVVYGKPLRKRQNLPVSSILASRRHLLSERDMERELRIG